MITPERVVVAGFGLRWVSLLLAGLMLLVECLPVDWLQGGYFTADKFQQGQWWLLFTSQWVHLNGLHTAFNVVAVVLVCESLLSSQPTLLIVLCAVVSAAAVATYLGFFPDTYRYYAGFSGILYGLLVYGLLCGWHGRYRLQIAIVAALLAAKLGIDVFGDDAFQPIGWLGARSAIEVHLAGIAGALGFVLLCRLVGLGLESAPPGRA